MHGQQETHDERVWLPMVPVIPSPLLHYRFDIGNVGFQYTLCLKLMSLHLNPEGGVHHVLPRYIVW